MSTYKTPGVYIQEINAFPNSVVPAPTAVPAFVGYTEFARRNGDDLTGVPTRITSLVEFEMLFGGGPHTQFDWSGGLNTPQATPLPQTSFLLHRSLRLFFENGGGPCWIVSVGGYNDAGQPTEKTAADFTGAVLEALSKEAEPAMLVAPDALLLPVDEWAEVMTQYLHHAARMRSRIVILDVYDGYKARSFDDDDVISGAKAGLRSLINADKPSFGAAYYPWVHTMVVGASEVTYLNLSEASRRKLSWEITAELKAIQPVEATDAERQTQKNLSSAIAISDEAAAALSGTDRQQVKRDHEALMETSPGYKRVMTEVLRQINTLPPAAGLAGVYARVDTKRGVFQAPANTSLNSVTFPTVPISHDDQQDLNAPLDGKAINAIRGFDGRGVLVWGARTLDGTSQDWRYVNVRRTMIMLEQSVKLAAEAYVFAPNDTSTWQQVKSMIENFLNNQWKTGALAGSKPEEAYDVSVGIGSKMTGNDVLEDYMRMTIRVAVTRPSEFIVITFQQKMPTS